MATAQEFIQTAAAELGNGAAKYNTGGQPWCAIFVNWCLKKIGYGKQGTAAACSFANFGANHKAGDGYTPKPGDLLLVNYTGSWADHVAIVESYSGGSLLTLNGNGTGRKVTRSRRNYNRTITIIEMSWSKSGASETETEKPTYFTNTNIIKPVHPTLFDQPDIAVEGVLAVYIGTRNITASTGALSWANSRMEFATTIDIEVAKSDARFTYLYQPQKGDIIRIFTDTEVFRGVIISDGTGGKHSNKYTAADAGWYICRIKDTYQFNNMAADAALKKIFGDLSVPIVYIDDAELKSVAVTGVYMDKTVSEIVSDILDEAGGEWNVDFVPQGVRIYKIGAFTATPMFRTSDNTALRDSAEYRGNENITSSIEDTKTAVKVISDERVLCSAWSEESYQDYGLLQETIKIDPEKENAEAVRDAKLAELNREKQTRSFDMIVQLPDYIRAGEVLEVESARYVIETATHTLQKGRHNVSVEVERIEIV